MGMGDVSFAARGQMCGEGCRGMLSFGARDRWDGFGMAKEAGEHGRFQVGLTTVSIIEGHSPRSQGAE